ncbi:hypothetical protein [uncultured Gemmiger sp.]|uniref:hypothetical protein n=1 Tax=uncultured Gemmiger sp. TaxID=1623490 RepID=UPI0025EB45F1|nr:hypothetical protein [uncultured Gemmiger sp.]
MKNLAGLLCALALLCSFCLPVFADNNDNTVEITTTVPTTHTITVDRVDGAAVFFNGQSGTTFTVDRFDQLQLLICPDSGRVLTRVLVNGEDVTALVQGGYYTLPAACEDLTLQVETTAAPQAASPASTPAPAQSAARPAKTPAPAKPEATPTEAPQPTTPTETPAPEAAPTETPQPTAPDVTPAPQTAPVTPLVWLIPVVLFTIVLLVLLRRKKGKK